MMKYKNSRSVPTKTMTSEYTKQILTVLVGEIDKFIFVDGSLIILKR